MHVLSVPARRHAGGAVRRADGGWVVGGRPAGGRAVCRHAEVLVCKHAGRAGVQGGECYPACNPTRLISAPLYLQNLQTRPAAPAEESKMNVTLCMMSEA